MNVWIDITNSPHVNFFADLINQLSANDDKLLLTCRPLANTIELLDLHEFDYQIVGRHYGKSRVRKVLGFAKRCTELYRALRKQPIDVAISHSSFYSPIVAKALGIPCIYLNDNEHAAGNRIAFKFATHIMVPEFLTMDALKAQGAKSQKVTHYPGVKEGIYLWSLPDKHDINTPTDTDAVRKRPTIIMRPEPWAAQYYSGGRDFLDELLLGLCNLGDVVLLPRGEVQAKHYRGAKFSSITIPSKPLTLNDFLESCDLFIGAGGTMTREAAVLGIPTISIYQDALLAVDQYLVECGAMVHNPRADLDFVGQFLADSQRREPNRELLEKGQQAFELIKTTLQNSAGVLRNTTDA